MFIVPSSCLLQPIIYGHPIINIVCCDVVSSCLSNLMFVWLSKIRLLFNNWTHSLRYVLSEF